MPPERDRRQQPPAEVAVRFDQVEIGADAVAPLALAGAWKVAADERRFGGVSSLAVTRGGFLAVTDAGVILRFPRPGTRSPRASLRDLPDGPGAPGFKSNRDSEALASDPHGRGWWVAFENRDQLWLYDQAFRRSLMTVAVNATDLARNRGVEAMAPVGDGLLLLPEQGDQAWLATDRRQLRLAWANPYGRLSEAARMPDGAVLVIARHLSLTGIRNRLLRLEVDNGRLVPRELAALQLGALDNVEAMAAERLGGDRTRLWLMTDNDFSRLRPTLLIAVDLPRSGEGR